MTLPINIKLPAQENKIDTNSFPELKEFAGQEVSIEDLLIFATNHDCSDLYITLYKKPYLSRYGKIFRVECVPISKTMWSKFFSNYVRNELNDTYVVTRQLDTSIEISIDENNPNYSWSPYYRYRAAFGFSNFNFTATFRMIKPKKITFSTINYNEQCIRAIHRAFSRGSGISYITGPTGSGKSTTMTAAVNTFLEKGEVLDNKVIITLEDPIENLLESTSSALVTQKELGKDFLTFAKGIKEALREHPNIIIVGECRDKDVICTAIEASRTGHNTITTFHSADVSGTLDRLIYHLDGDKNLALDLILQMNIILSQKMLQSNNQYIVDTQYVLFTDDVTKRVVQALNNPDSNIILVIEELIHNPELQRAGIVKDWEHKELHDDTKHL